MKCNINSSEEIKEAVDHILSNESTIDVLINNAGIGITGPIEETSDEEIKPLFKQIYLDQLK